ncbi:hypothetical protein LTR09_009782 [Extremus antarcticus]|uniref:Major facilitator superfamily (MFS) profile domain-containing protein n=1 Tax=Extremus antarcticus TaxID=702011 RepID=A0AAJ0D8G5_9PEZI|nr:hypothetical protein LTR09_009782 [Extremus antarcticus]
MARLNGTIRAYLFGYFLCLPGFLFGYDTGIVGGVLTLESYERDFGYTDTTTVSAVMVSLQNVGAFLAAISIFTISKRFGRRKTMMIACCIFSTGVILQVVPSGSLACFYVGRFVAGLGLGSATAVAPSYNVEMAPKEIRGRLGSGVQWLFALGVMISYWIDYAVATTLPVSSKQWQIPVGLQLVPPVVIVLGLIPCHESVRWLVKKDRIEEAWASLKWIRANDGPEVRAEFEEIKTGLAEEYRASAGFTKRELLEPANRYRLLLGTGLFLGQQCTGMTALAYFAPQIFTVLVGDNESQALLITGLFGAEKFIMCGLYIILVSERFNRRPTFWISPILMAICFTIVCIVNKTAFGDGTGPNAHSSGIATVALIFLTNSIYQFSWGPLCWPYTAEIFPSRIREFGAGLAVSTQWLFNFLFSLVTPYMVNSIGAYVFLFYAALDLIMALMAFIFVKETKGRSIEEMETIFNSVAAFDVNEARKRGAEENDAEIIESLATAKGTGTDL